MILISLTPFTTEEITGSNNEAVKGANTTPRKLPSSFFVSCFTVPLTPINTAESSREFMIPTVLSISSFGVNKENSFLALRTPFPLIFLKTLSNIDKVALFANLGKISLAKGTLRSSNPFLPKLPDVLPINLPE